MTDYEEGDNGAGSGSGGGGRGSGSRARGSGRRPSVRAVPSCIVMVCTRAARDGLDSAVRCVGMGGVVAQMRAGSDVEADENNGEAASSASQGITEN